MNLDKTEIILSEMKAVIDSHYSRGVLFSHNRIMGEIDHYIKTKAIRAQGKISSAAIQLGLKRTTLVEYLRKLGLNLDSVLNGND